MVIFNEDDDFVDFYAGARVNPGFKATAELSASEAVKALAEAKFTVQRIGAQKPQFTEQGRTLGPTKILRNEVTYPVATPQPVSPLKTITLEPLAHTNIIDDIRDIINNSINFINALDQTIEEEVPTWVSNIPNRLTDQRVIDLFQRHNPLSAQRSRDVTRLVATRPPGRSSFGVRTFDIRSQ